jgi:hypothetical protein
MKLENIILGKVSQAQKTKTLMFSLIYGLQIKGKCSNVIGVGSQAKWRAHMERMGIVRKLKT